MGKRKEICGNQTIEFGVASLEARIDIDGATEFGAGENFFDAKRMNGNVGEGLVFAITSHASEAVGGIFDEK